VAVAILRHVEGLAECLPAILHHHERFDGSGYPLGLVGTSIPMEARIISVADSYDAMTSDRPYRRALGPERALDELILCTGRQFDPQVVQVFADLVEGSSPQLTRIHAEMVRV
jgi:HD-GYP domain-containing protein (c-di-GMP phosphodiesterase class II)